VAHTDNAQLRVLSRRFTGQSGQEEIQFAGPWDSTPRGLGVADGIPSRVDRLAALGDAVVPQQVYPILKAIAEIERSNV